MVHITKMFMQGLAIGILVEEAIGWYTVVYIIIYNLTCLGGALKSSIDIVKQAMNEEISICF